MPIPGMKTLFECFRLEDQEMIDKKLEDMKFREEVSRGCSRVAEIRADVDKFSKRVAAMEKVVIRGTKVCDKELILLTELLMKECLKLDGIEAAGEARLQRKNEVIRIQSLQKTLDSLRARNSLKR